MTAIPYRIRRSDRARRARIVVGHDGVEVVVPRRMALRHVEPFVEEKRAWIERTLRRLGEAEAAFPVPRVADGAVLPYLGERLVLRAEVEPGRTRAHVRRAGAELVAWLPDADRSTLTAAVERWYRRAARSEVSRRLDAECARAGRSWSKLTIRNQRTRWASCSEGGAMSFNWRLLLAPPEILDYVVCHEVCHLDVLDHSPAFWALVAERRPRYREHERWLRLHGQALRLA